MFHLRVFRRLFGWIALLAILGGALAPAISHMADHDRADKAVLEVCTAEGARMVTMHGDADPVKNDKPLHFSLEHCPFCIPHAGSLGLLPSSVLVFHLPADGAQYFPPLFLSAPYPLFVWASAQPRAPPVFSV